jgi:hypothetical protein
MGSQDPDPEYCDSQFLFIAKVARCRSALYLRGMDRSLDPHPALRLCSPEPLA